MYRLIILFNYSKPICYRGEKPFNPLVAPEACIKEFTIN